MAWSSKTQIMTSQSVAGTELFSSAVTLNPGESAHVEVEGDFPVTPNDDLEVRVYGTLDDSTENWDDTPIYKFTISNSIDPNKASIVIIDVYKFRVGAIRTGATDTITTNMWYRKDGVSL